MAMVKALTIEEVRKAGVELRKGVRKFGLQYSPNYSKQTLAEMVVTALDHGNHDAPSKEEHTKLARQLTACQAREAGLRKQLKEGDTSPEGGYPS